MRKNLWGFIILAGAFTACDSESELPTAALNEKAPLKIDVKADGFEEEGTKAMFTGTSFANNTEIRVYVLNSSGAGYDGQATTNLKYTLSSSGWGCGKTIYLSSTTGTVYAYYPYNSSLANPEAIAMTATTAPGGGTDYMYATAKSVSQKAPTAALTMKHALTAVKVSIKKGTYKGAGKVTALTWTSDGAGTGGSLNAKTGAVSSVTGTGTVFNAGLTAESSYTITTTAKDYTFMAVPAGTSKALSFSVTMDGKTFTVNSAAVILGQGKLHQYILTMDAKTMTVSKVTLTDWANQTEEGLKPSF